MPDRPVVIGYRRGNAIKLIPSSQTNQQLDAILDAKKFPAYVHFPTVYCFSKTCRAMAGEYLYRRVDLVVAAVAGLCEPCILATQVLA